MIRETFLSDTEKANPVARQLLWLELMGAQHLVRKYKKKKEKHFD